MQQQRKADLALVCEVVCEQGSGHCPESAIAMLTEGLPFALPLPTTVGEGATAAVHKFQASFLEQLEKCLAEAKARAEDEDVSVAAAGKEAAAELDERHKAAEQASSELDEASAKVDAKNAHINELDAALTKAEANHAKYEAKGSKKQQEWEKLRQLHEAAKAVDEGALRMLEEEEGDEETRSATAAAATAFIVEQNAEQVLQSAAPLALAVKPSARGVFDRMTAEAVLKIVKNRIADLSEKLESIAPEEKNLKAEVAGLWAIADCARDALMVANQELVNAESVVRDERKPAAREARDRVKEKERDCKAHAAAKESAALKGQQVADATAALERLARPKVEEEVGEPEAKRQRADEETA